MQKKNRQRQALQTRVAIVQALYQADQSKTSLQDITSCFLKRGKLELEEYSANLKLHPEEYIEKLDAPLFLRCIDKILDMRPLIESFIQKTLLTGRSLEKLEPLLKAILIAGVAEFLIGKAPPAVIISEYVRVTHGFFENSESKLVNGILQTIAKRLDSSKKNES